MNFTPLPVSSTTPVGGLHRLVADPDDGMGRFIRARAYGVNDHVTGFFARQVGAVSHTLQSRNGGITGVFHYVYGAIRGFYGNCFCGGIDLLNRTGYHV
jgi:hypothetical protein